MLRPIITLALLSVPLLAVGCSPGQPDLYDGFRDDLVTMRETYREPGTVYVASTGPAIEAAARVFQAYPKPGTSRREVLATLGNPATISSYAQDPTDNALIYVFNVGWGGVAYRIEFSSWGNVISVTREEIY